MGGEDKLGAFKAEVTTVTAGGWERQVATLTVIVEVFDVTLSMMGSPCGEGLEKALNLGFWRQTGF